MVRPPSIWLVLVAAALVAAAIAVPIVFFTHRALMATASELQQLDDLVRKQVNSPRVQRLSAPDRIEQEGDAKTGYFTYLVSDAAESRKLHVDWRIERGQVQIVAIKSL